MSSDHVSTTTAPLVVALLVPDDDRAPVEWALRNWSNPRLDVRHVPSLASLDRLIERDPPDVVVLAIDDAADRTPTDAFDELDELVRRHPQLPVVTLSARPGPAVATEAVRRGADDHVRRVEAASERLARAALSAVLRRRRPGSAVSPSPSVTEQLQTERRRTRAIHEHSADVVMFFGLDGTIEWVGPSSRRLLGFDPQDLIGRNGFDLVHPDDRAAVVASFAGMEQPRASLTTSFRVIAPDGSIRWMEETATNLCDDPDVGHIVANLRDITDQRRSEDSLRFQADVLATIGEAVAATDVDGRITYLNAAAERLYGWSLADAIGHNGGAISVGGGQDGARLLDRQLHSGQPWRGEMRLRRRDGSEFFGQVTNTPLFGDDGEVVGMIGVTSDITDRHAAEVQLAHEVRHDPLTGLPNRVAIADRIEELLEAQRCGGPTVAVAFLDLDRFKVINDGLGHTTGDRVLLAVADRLRATAGPAVTVGRFGGDEFVIVGPASPDEAARIACGEQLLDPLAAPIEVDDRHFYVNASVGIAVSAPGDDADRLLQAADTAMYESKRSATRRVTVFDAALRQRSERSLRIETDLRTVVARGELEVYYQPVVRLEDGSCVGFEALLRWQHPELGWIEPHEFIPIAEETGSIHELGNEVLRLALRQLRAWHLELGDERVWMAVNVSANQVAEGQLGDDVRRALDDSEVPADRLHLEITESVLMDRIDDSLVTLDALRRTGIQLSVDDFGTGYSSLSYLKRLPIHTLKVDRSFVDGLGSDPHDTSIVRAVSALTRTLSLELLAEGVETQAQRRALLDLGCEFGQGYLWARPMTAPAATEWLRSHLRPLDAAEGFRHLVEFFDDDEHLVDTVASFVGTALVRDGVGVLIATEAHRRAVLERLSASGIGADAMLRSGHLIEIDADDAFERLVSPHGYDHGAGLELVSSSLAVATRRARTGPVRIFGELVGLLWAGGHPDAAIELERSWSELGSAHDLWVLCGYPADLLDGESLGRRSSRPAHAATVPAVTPEP